MENIQNNTNKIYVGNLPFSTTQEELQNIFSQYGPISTIRLITDRETGRSKGFAFISFETPEAMEAALNHHDQELDGRKLRVNQAIDKPKA